MFWKKKAKCNSQEDQIKKANYDFIINAIQELNSGNIDYIHIVYGAFATSDIFLIEEAGKVIGKILKPFTESQMIKLDERFRQYTSLEWSVDWRNVNILSSKNFINDIEDWKKILILGSFHPNGFFREQCILELIKYEGTLPYLILRMNDWVYKVRVLSFRLIIEKVSYCSIFEILSSMQFWDKVKKSQRRGTDELNTVQNELVNKIEANIHLVKMFNLYKYAFNTRKSIYKILFAKPLLSIDEANIILEKEKHSYCKSIIIRGILATYYLPIEQLDLYINNKNNRVRINSLQYKYDIVKNSWSGLESMLLDNNHAIRDFTIFILKKHTTINVLNYYIDALNGDDSNMGIIGIGENGNKTHSYLLMPFLKSKCEKTVKFTLMSLGKLMGCDDNDIYWSYLFDSRCSVSKVAYLSIRRNMIRYGAPKLFYEFNRCCISHVRRNLLLLLMQDNSWSRLPYLLSIYNYDDINLRNKIRMKIEHRNIYGKVSTQETSYIRNVMKEKKDELPDNLIRSIEFDLKFVEC